MIRRHSTRLSQAHDEPEDDQAQHTAARDYPELGTVLTDRPDPGQQITVIGMRRHGDAYGTPEDARSGEYNGGEGDLGMYWAEPGQQAWKEENLGPQEEAPPPLYSPDTFAGNVMARLHAMEEAQGFFGMRHHATSINGTQIDDAGDAPEHGTVPRAGEPNSYDDRSTEGQGDPRWNQALPASQHGDKKAENGATVGMYPEGMSAGGGPGLEIGAFTAALPPGELDELRRHVGGDHGFPVQDSYGDAALSAIHDGLHMSGLASHSHADDDYETNPAWDRDAGGYHEFTGSRRTARVPWTGKERGSLHRWQEEPTATWGDFVPSSEFPLLGAGEHVSHEDGGDGIGPVEGAGGLDDRFGPDITSLGPAMKSPSGYPLALPENGGSAADDPEKAVADSRDFRPRPQEDVRERDPDRFLRMMNALNVHVRIDGKELHDHDDPDNSLDAAEDKKPDSPQDKNDPGNESSQADDADSLDSPQDSPQGLPAPGTQEDNPEADPSQWPQAGADVNETSRAYTQGSGDGKVKRGTPPAPQQDQENDPGNQDDSSGPDDDSTPFSKDGALAMFTASAASPAFRFEFTATWNDVVAKAKRIRAGGHVRIVHASASMVIGEVRGDHDTYETGIQRPVGKRQTIQHWACGCPWASFHQKTAARSFNGRPCSHVMALQFEAQARGMFGRQFSSDAEVPAWAPQSVVVKSWPPYEGEPHAGRWREEWRAPLAHLRRPGGAPGAPGDVLGAPVVCATAALVRAGEDPAEVGALQVLAGMRTEAETSSVLRVACMGNSIAANGNGPEGDNPDLSFLRWASRLSAGCIRHAGSFSADGASSSQILASQMAPVVASKPDACIIGPWVVNNPVLGVSFDRTAADVENAVLALRVAGIAPLLSLEPPAPDQERSAFVRQYNEWAQHFAARSGVPVADFFASLTGRNGDWAEGYSADGIHPTAAGARAMGRTVAGLLNSPAVVIPAPLASLRYEADQSNAPWGSQNVTQSPPQKPYGATSPPNKDQDPGSYGPLAGPDPENWGGIQEDSVMQMPLSNTASHPVPGDTAWPATEGWQDEDQDDFPYSDRSATAGPSTSISPRDPQGIRMEEARVTAAGTPFPVNGTVPQLDGALAELHDRPEPALPETTGDDETAKTAAADGTIGGNSAGTGMGHGAPLDTAALGEFGASVRASFRQMFGGTPMGDLNRETSPQAQQPSPVTQEPGLGSMDDALSPEDPSIQTIGNQQWSGGGADSDEVAVPAGQSQGGIEDIVASFQRSAAAKGYAGGGGPGPADGDIAAAARQHLSRTADVLPKEEADELVREGAGSRARNLDLLRLEGTHYEDEDEDLARKGISLDNYDDDVIFA